MKHLILQGLLAISSLSLFAQNTMNPLIGDTDHLPSFGMPPEERSYEQPYEAGPDQDGLAARKQPMIIPLKSVQIIRFSPCRVYAGYTSAFSRNTLKTSPGFEIGGLYTRHLFKRVSLQAGLGYVMRNQTLRVSGAAFALRNERWSASLLLHMYPNFNWQWAKRFSFKAGVQADFFAISSPLYAYDAATNVRNTAVEKKGTVLKSKQQTKKSIFEFLKEVRPSNYLV